MRLVRTILLPIVIVGTGVAVSLVIAGSAQSPERQERSAPGPLVDTLTVALQDHAVEVRGLGTVQARTMVQLTPQVGGKVISIHPQLVAGGYFRAGETLLTIDPVDYQLAVQRAEATVARARVTLQLQEAEAEVARREWQHLHPGQQPGSPLVTRQPQVDQAKAELVSAEADLAGARLALGRTELSLPFAGRVLSKSIDIGQLVIAGQPVVSVYGTAAMEIPVPLEDSELAWFDVPDGNRRLGQAPVTVQTDFAGELHRWQGRIERAEAQVDPATRMVQVVAVVNEPLSLHDDPQPLVPGMFVEVIIAGRTLAGAALIPRHAVHNGNQVWLVRDNRLQIETVQVARSEAGQAVVTSGLAPGDRLVTSQLDVVTDGMVVRTTEAAPADPATGAEARS